MVHYRNIERRNWWKREVFLKQKFRQTAVSWVKKTFENEYGKRREVGLFTNFFSDNSGKCMAKNTYQDICYTLLSRVDGHPDRI